MATDPRYQEIVEKAWNDEKFKERLIANPKEVLEKEQGIHIPSGTNLKVIVEEDDEICIIIPSSPESLEFFDKKEIAEGLVGVW